MRTRNILIIVLLATALMATSALAQSATAAAPQAAPAPHAVAVPRVQAVPLESAVPQALAVPMALSTAQVPKVVAAPRAPEPPAPPVPPQPIVLSKTNVRVDVTISDQSGSGAPTKKSISLTVGDGGRGSVRSGVTIPIASASSTSTGSKEPNVNPFVSWSYKDMGLSLDVENVAVQGNLIRLRLGVEYTPVDEKTASSESAVVPQPVHAPVSFARFSQSLTLVLEDGKPLVVAQASDPVPSRNRSAAMEVKATILK
jgi:hypothetical protein